MDIPQEQIPGEDEASRRRDYHAALDELTRRGWMTGWRKCADTYFIDWTPKGRERVRWLQTIDAELNPDERAMSVVMGICCALGPDERN